MSHKPLKDNSRLQTMPQAINIKQIRSLGLLSWGPRLFISIVTFVFQISRWFLP